jgi:hypothetical protein
VKAKPKNGWSLGDNVGLCLAQSPPFYHETTFVIGCPVINFSLNLMVWLTAPILTKLDTPGLALRPTIYVFNSLLLSWWEFAVLLSLRSLFLISLDVCFQRCSPVSLIQEKVQCILLSGWEPCSSPLFRCLLLRMPFCLS